MTLVDIRRAEDLESYKSIGYDDVLPMLIGIAGRLAEMKICARVLLGGSCAIILQSNCREKAADLDLILLEYVQGGFPQKEQAQPKRTIKLFSSSGVGVMSAGETTPQARFMRLLARLVPDEKVCGDFPVYSTVAKIVSGSQKGKIDKLPFVSIRDQDGYGLIVDVMSLADIHRLKREKTARTTAMRIKPDSLTGRDEHRLNRLLQVEKAPPGASIPSQWKRRPFTFRDIVLQHD